MESVLPPRPASVQGSVSAVIVNWRTPDDTIRSARALFDDGLEPARLTVVDSGSGDDSVERIADALPAARVIALGENIGYGRACNVGAEAAGAFDVLLFVNSDAFVHRPASVPALVVGAQRPGGGLAVPRLLNEDLTLQGSVVALRTPAAALVHASGLTRFLPDELQPRVGTRWRHAEGRWVRSATGAVIAVTRPAWEALGGFQPVAHMYAEDHDLFWRAAKLGIGVWFTAASEFVHVGGGSTSRVYSDAGRARRVAEAEATMIRRHLRPWPAGATISILRFGHRARALVFRLLGRREAEAEQRGYADGFR